MRACAASSRVGAPAGASPLRQQSPPIPGMHAGAAASTLAPAMTQRSTSGHNTAKLAAAIDVSASATTEMRSHRNLRIGTEILHPMA